MSHDYSDDDVGDEYTVQGGWDDTEQLIITLVSAVADCTGRDVMDLDPLYEVIKPNALTQIFEPRNAGRIRGDGGRLTFAYAGCTVLVTNDEITVRPKDGAQDRVPMD